MNRNNFFLKIQQQMNDVFELQDPELLDVVFEIEGKKLYADKLRLSVVSSTFKSMLSERWNLNKNETIKITSYKFDDFKEFLSFIYSYDCTLNDSNIFTMLDMAEFYQVADLKELCDQYLSNMQISFNNIIELLDASNKYCMNQMKEALHRYVPRNLENFLKLDKFLNADRMFIEELVTSQPNYLKPEDIFEAVYQWSEHRALKKQEESVDENFNKNDAIKNEFSPFLQFISFKKMKLNYLLERVVKKDALYPWDQLNTMLENVDFNFKVTITNLHGQSISGSLPYDSDAVEIIKALKNCKSGNVSDDIAYWNTRCKIPIHPSLIKKREGVEYYLIHFCDGDIGARHASAVDEYSYILAEMTIAGSSGFRFTYNCRIE